jgi:VWFA-related protein
VHPVDGDEGCVTSRAGAVLAIVATVVVVHGQAPEFRAGAERVLIDAAIVDAQGQVVPDLRTGEIAVRVDGKPRRIASIEFVRTAANDTPAGTDPAALPAFSSNEGANAGRLVLLLVDQASISAGGGRQAMAAAADFVDELGPADRIGLIAFPRGVRVELTRDRASVRAALARVAGAAAPTAIRYRLSLSEALSLEAGTGDRQQIVARECQGAAEREREACEIDVDAEARGLVAVTRERTNVSLTMLHALFSELRKIDAPKTIVWISGGLIATDRQGDIARLADEALNARASLYVVQIDGAGAADVLARGPSATASGDRTLLGSGLELLAGMSRGALFRVAGAGAGSFRRIRDEMAGFYLVAIEPEPGDRDGRPHEIALTTTRAGLSVRARRRFVVGPTTSEAAVEKADERVKRLLRAPLPATALSVRVATYPLAPTGGGTVDVMIAAELGRREILPQDVTLGFAIIDEAGKAANVGFQTVKATPLDASRPSPLQHTGRAALAPGRYVLRFAADAGGRAGSVEHRFEVPASTPGTPLAIGALVLGVSTSQEDQTLRPVAEPVVARHTLRAWTDLRLPRERLASARAHIEIARRADGPALSQADASIGDTSDERRIVTEGQLPVAVLPPGHYTARLIVEAEGLPRATALREFEVVAAPEPGATLFAVDISHLVGPFTPDAVLASTVLGPVLERALAADGTGADADARRLVETATRDGIATLDPKALHGRGQITTAMLRGAALLQRGQLEDAALSFREAVRASPDFLPGIVYLGACYAAGGKMRDAVGAWQTALASETDTPLVFRLASDGLLRLGDTEEAASLLEEAVGLWPDDATLRVRRAAAVAAADPGAALDALLPLIERGEADEWTGGFAARLAAATAVRKDPSARQRLERLVAAQAAAGQQPSALATIWLETLARRTMP